MIRNLIYDVGMHEGEDTQFYIARGFKVVSIEANPQLAARIRQDPKYLFRAKRNRMNFSSL
jgi:hypothetical protein